MADPDLIFPVMTDRDALPEPLRLLLDSYPREGWEAHPNFQGLVQFWMERHLMFRQLLERLGGDAQEMLDGGLGAEAYAPRLGRFGNMLLEQLHGHHQIEDQHYFPLLARAEPRLERGFDMLERDHLALDPALVAFAEAANGMLRGPPDEAAAREATAGVLSQIEGLTRLLDRHLTDEEELVVPVVLKTGAG